MAIDSIEVFKTTFAADMVPVNDPSWAANLANWTDARVTGKMDLPGLGGPPRVYTFVKAAFQVALLAMAPTNDASAAITILATAWASAIGAMIVVPGTYIGALPLPPVTWSVVNSSLIDVPSIAAGQAKIQELENAEPEADVLDSEFPIKFHEAFLLLTVSTLGFDSTPPGSGGPLPLNDLLRAVA